MPIYEYTCKRCGDFEVTQRISDDPLKKCPACGIKVTKLISRSAFHLRGSGWYMTDYAKNGSSKPSGDDAQETKNEKKDTATSSEASSSSKESSTKKSSPAKEHPSSA